MKKRLSWVFVVLLVLLVAGSKPVGAEREDTFRITFMNIGRNDGILIVADGEAAFIDSGTQSYGKTAVRYLNKQGITHLKYYIGTHGHRDHVGGAPNIMTTFDADEVLVPHEKVITQIRRFASGAAQKAKVKSARYRVMKPGQRVALGRAILTCLGPIHVIDCAPDKIRENYNSLILRVDYGANSFLLTADAMTPEFTAIEKRFPGMLNAQVVKNPHHNGKQPLGFLDQTQPEIYVFSTAKSNLPNAKYVAQIQRRGARVYVTAANRDGHVTVFSNGSRLRVSTQKG